MTVRTLFIGLDGATFTVLNDLVKPGEGGPVMPFLARIFANGARAKLRSTPNPLTPPAWVSMMTGRNPGHHGVYDFIRAEERADDVFFTLSDSRDCRVETIWSIASRQGKKVAVLNFPFTAPPPKDLNGVMVPGFVPWRHLRRNSYPEGLYDRLKTIPDFNAQELAWDFEQEKQSGNELSDKDREEWVSYHLPREKQWFKVAEFLMREESPDLMAVLFDGVDKLQHQAWPYVDPAMQEGELSEFHHRMRALSLGYFKQLDGFIEELVTAAGPDVQVFFVVRPRLHGVHRDRAHQRLPRTEGLRALPRVAPGRCRPAPRQQLLCLPRLDEDGGVLPHAVLQRHHHPGGAQPGRHRHRAVRVRSRAQPPDPRPGRPEGRSDRRAHHHRDPQARGRVPRRGDERSARICNWCCATLASCR